jgi:hypothetical protein
VYYCNPPAWLNCLHTQYMTENDKVQESSTPILSVGAHVR